MRAYLRFYIGGKWVEPAQSKTLEVINPATETVCGHISLCSAADVDRAAAAESCGLSGLFGRLDIPPPLAYVPCLFYTG
jgi:aldehyde dehydrogenase (NAD+)